MEESESPLVRKSFADWEVGGNNHRSACTGLVTMVVS